MNDSALHVYLCKKVHLYWALIEIELKQCFSMNKKNGGFS